LPELVDSSCGILELVFGRNNGVDRRCYQIIGFEDKAIKPMFLITFIPFVERSFLGFPFSQGSV
jgi:hypothetical protein